MVYLDYAANTPVDPAVLQCFTEAADKYIANPNSTHPLGKMAQRKMEEAILELSRHFNLDEEMEIIYTSGASESNNLAIKGITDAYKENGKHIISTYLEHPSVSGSLTYLQNQGYEIDLLDITPKGQVDLDQLRELLRSDTVLMTVCYVDSELGTVQPIKQIAEILKDYPNCYFHTDATQAVGKIPLDLDGVDCFSFAPHKFYGLNGIGVLIKKKSLVLTPIIHGGSGTTIYRSGTPVLAQAAAASKAVSIAYENMKDRYDYVKDLNHYLKEKLSEYPLVQINSTENSIPFILNIGVKSIKASVFKEALEEYDICVSIKSACSVANTPSRPVFAITGSRKDALSSWRISISHLTTYDEINTFLEAFDICYGRLTKKDKM